MEDSITRYFRSVGTRPALERSRIARRPSGERSLPIYSYRYGKDIGYTGTVVFMGFLQEGENIILQDSAKSDFFGKGTLYLTNTRMVFEVITGGFLSKTPEIKIDQQIRSIQALSVSGRKGLRVHFEGNMEPTTLYVDNPGKWEASIRTVISLSGGT